MWQGRIREVNQKTLVLILVRDDGNSGQSSSREGGEKWSDFRYILNVGPAIFANQLICAMRKSQGWF